MSAFNPSKSFAFFDAQKLLKLAEFYLKEFSNNNLLKLELQLHKYIDDMRQDDSFKGLDNIVDLSVKLVETKRHKVYDMVMSSSNWYCFYLWPWQVLKGYFYIGFCENKVKK
jgi:hypothetical protein